MITAASEEECGISLMKDTVYMLTGESALLSAWFVRLYGDNPQLIASDLSIIQATIQARKNLFIKLFYNI